MERPPRGAVRLSPVLLRPPRPRGTVPVMAAAPGAGSPRACGRRGASPASPGAEAASCSAGTHPFSRGALGSRRSFPPGQALGRGRQAQGVMWKEVSPILCAGGEPATGPPLTKPSPELLRRPRARRLPLLAMPCPLGVPGPWGTPGSQREASAGLGEPSRQERSGLRALPSSGSSVVPGPGLEPPVTGAQQGLGGAG